MTILERDRSRVRRRRLLFPLRLGWVGVLASWLLIAQFGCGGQTDGVVAEQEPGQPLQEIQAVPSVLFVGRSVPLIRGDAKVAERLRTHGFALTLATDRELSAERIAAHDVLLVSSSANSWRVLPYIDGLATPIVTWEAWLLDNLELAGPIAEQDYGYDSGTALTIQRPEHGLAAGLVGEVAVYSQPELLAWARPSTGATVVATLAQDPERAAILACEQGQVLAGQMVCTARRVGVFANTDLAAPLTESGYALIEAAVEWATRPATSPDWSDAGTVVDGGVAPVEDAGGDAMNSAEDSGADAGDAAGDVEAGTESPDASDGGSLDAGQAPPLDSAVEQPSVAGLAGLLLVGRVELGTGDQAVLALMQSLDLDASVLLAAEATALALAQADLILVSSSVNSGDIAGLLPQLTAPVVVWEPFSFDDLALTGVAAGQDYGSTALTTQLRVVDNFHPITRGLLGPQEVYVVPQRLGWGRPGAGAEVLATAADSTLAVVFAYDTQALLVSGEPAPARRVALFANTDRDTVFGAAGLELVRRAIVWAGGGDVSVEGPEPPTIVEVSPPHSAVDVPTTLGIRLYVSEAIDTRTATAERITLQTVNGTRVASSVGTDATGGVITLNPQAPLQPLTSYTIRVDRGVSTPDGREVAPFTAIFTTGTYDAIPESPFAFTRQALDGQDANTTLALGPDGHLYVFNIANDRSELRRYLLDGATSLPTGPPEILWQSPEQVLGLAFEPTPDVYQPGTEMRMWISHAMCNSLTGRDAPDGFSSGISVLTIPAVGGPESPEQEPYITGLPNSISHCAHQINGLTFGPSGELYASIGSTSTLGGTPNWQNPESLLSAAIVVADVLSPGFAAAGLPVDVRTDGTAPYDPYAPEARVRLYATGVRNAYDLLWHSNGVFYTADNQNSLGGGTLTPACGGAPPVSARPSEMLYRLRPQHYYGHPNPSRLECVLNGGNPTAAVDPFEVTQYPIGTLPLFSFDSELIYDLRPSGGNSANGLAEYPSGPLAGRMLAAYYTGTKTIQTFSFAPTGEVMDTRPLVDIQGDPISFVGALDVVVDARTGVVFVADFGRQADASGGALYALEPANF